VEPPRRQSELQSFLFVSGFLVIGKETKISATKTRHNKNQPTRPKSARSKCHLQQFFHTVYAPRPSLCCCRRTLPSPRAAAAPRKIPDAAAGPPLYSFFLARKKNRGVNTPFFPPATRPSAARSSIVATSRLPLGATPTASRPLTRQWVTLRPSLVVLKSGWGDRGGRRRWVDKRGVVVSGGLLERSRVLATTFRKHGPAPPRISLATPPAPPKRKQAPPPPNPAPLTPQPPRVGVHGVPPRHVRRQRQVGRLHHLKAGGLQAGDGLRGGADVRQTVAQLDLGHDLVVGPVACGGWRGVRGLRGELCVARRNGSSGNGLPLARPPCADEERNDRARMIKPPLRPALHSPAPTSLCSLLLGSYWSVAHHS